MKTSSFSHFSLVFFLVGAFIFLTAPLLLVVQSKYRGMPYYRKESRQLRRHYLQATVDVYCDRAKRGGEYPEYSVLLIREFLHSGKKSQRRHGSAAESSTGATRLLPITMRSLFRVEF